MRGTTYPAHLSTNSRVQKWLHQAILWVRKRSTEDTCVLNGADSGLSTALAVRHMVRKKILSIVFVVRRFPSDLTLILDEVTSQDLPVSHKIPYNPKLQPRFQALAVQYQSPGNPGAGVAGSLSGKKVRGRLQLQLRCAIALKFLCVSSPQTGAPSSRLCDRQLGLPALVVSAKLSAITTKPLYFLKTIFPFAIS